MRKNNVFLTVMPWVLLFLSLCFNGYLLYHNNLVSSNIKSSSNTYNPNVMNNEEYVWISTLTDHPMYINHDQKALKQFGRDMGVKVTIEGPKEYDIPGQAAAIEKVIERRPAGIMVLGMERGLIPMVNKAVRAGIPTITVDADLVDSNRLAFVGSNWWNIGVKQAEELVKLIGGKGKVAIMGIVGADNMEEGFAGFKSVIEDYPEVILVGEYDDMCDDQEAERLTEDILRKYPDIAGIAGFDVNSGPGIGEAIKKADLVGRIKVTCVDIEPIHLKLVKEGVVQKLIGQKRELFTYYGARLLYDYNHATINITRDDKSNSITRIPYIIDTGLIEVDINNVDSIMMGND